MNGDCVQFTYHFLKVIEIILKLVITILCSNLLAYNHKLAFKNSFNHILVMTSFAVCLLALLWQQLPFAQNSGLSVIFFSSIIVALGIFTSGLVLSQRGSVSSITLSASIWVAGGIGISIGFSLYYTAIVATLIGYIFLRLVDRAVVDE